MSPVTIRLDPSDVDRLYLWVHTQFTEDTRIAEAAQADDYQSVENESDAMRDFCYRFDPEDLATRSREHLALLGDLQRHLHSNTDTGRLARRVLQRLGAGMGNRDGYREEWRA